MADTGKCGLKPIKKGKVIHCKILLLRLYLSDYKHYICDISILE